MEVTLFSRLYENLPNGKSENIRIDQLSEHTSSDAILDGIIQPQFTILQRCRCWKFHVRASHDDILSADANARQKSCLGPSL